LFVVVYPDLEARSFGDRQWAIKIDDEKAPRRRGLLRPMAPYMKYDYFNSADVLLLRTEGGRATRVGALERSVGGAVLCANEQQALFDFRFG
jgi:hypothetical protein